MKFWKQLAAQALSTATDAVASIARLGLRVSALERKVIVMSKAEDDLKAGMTALNTATNDVAAELKTLSDTIAQGVTADNAQAVVGQMNALAQRLEGLAVDPANPVPTSGGTVTPPPTDTVAGNGGNA